MQAASAKSVRNSVILAILAITGCSGDAKSTLVGSWEGISLQQDLRFHEGGAAELIDRKHGTYPGTCTVTGGDKMTCSFEGLAFPVVRRVRIRGDKLHLINRNGQEETYRRK